MASVRERLYPFNCNITSNIQFGNRWTGSSARPTTHNTSTPNSMCASLFFKLRLPAWLRNATSTFMRPAILQKERLPWTQVDRAHSRGPGFLVGSRSVKSTMGSKLPASNAKKSLHVLSGLRGNENRDQFSFCSCSCFRFAIP